ncbi:transducin beta-like protein 3 [Dinothrombium tinctorium]|uniref:Transducin beta-like protein 3 n=1 Tax=Dinothrombium tinctorium TaxID=1965070 RepID=A0A3S3P9D7_9ACAR|nr:transducin beta-like protein 3 [Dinothrombium tinctorium]
MTKHVLKESLAVRRKIEPIFTCLKLRIDESGQFLFTCCENKIKVIDIQNGTVLKQIPPNDELDDEIVNFIENDAYLFIAYKSGFIKQWSLKSEELSLKRTWNTSHIGAISFMTFDSVTKTLLATGGSDSLIKIWDTERQYITHYLKGCSGFVSYVQFHPKPIADAPYYLLASGAHDCVVNVYDLKLNKLVNKLEGHSAVVTGIHFFTNDDSDYVLTCSRDKILIVWSLENFTSVRKIPVFESLESLFLIPKNKNFRNIEHDGNLVVTAGEKGVLKVFNIEKGNLVYEQENSILSVDDNEDQQSQLITQLVYSAKSEEIAVVSFENNILFYKLADFTLIRQFVGYNDEVLDVKFLGEEENFVVVATNSKHIKIFDLQSFNCSIIKGHSDIVLAIAVFQIDPFIFASSSKDNTIRVWKFNPETLTAICLFRGSGHSHSVTSISAPFRSLDWVVSGSEDTTMKLWRIPNIKKAMVENVSLTSKTAVRAHEKDINSIAVSPNDKLICTGSQDKTAKLWSVGDRLELAGVLRGHRRGIWCVIFSPVDQVVATSSADATIKIWSISDLSCLKTFEGHDCSVLKVQFITKGMQLISTSSDGNLKLWTVKSNECTKTIDAHDNKIWSFAVSKDEQTIITGSSDSRIVFWKDVTIEEQEEAAAKMEKLVEQEQTLANLMRKKKWKKAIKVAILLEQPFRALNIIKEIIYEEEYKEGDKEDLVKESLSGLREDQLLSLLRYAVKWNTNSKHCEAAQRVLRIIFSEMPPETLLKIPEAKETVESLLPFTERHFNRLSYLHQQVNFMEFLWSNMKLTDISEVKQ